MPLFERGRRRICLTEQGRLRVPEAHDILARVAALPGRLDGSKEALRGTRLLAASQTIGRYCWRPDSPNSHIGTRGPTSSVGS